MLRKKKKKKKVNGFWLPFVLPWVTAHILERDSVWGYKSLKGHASHKGEEELWRKEEGGAEGVAWRRAEGKGAERWHKKTSAAWVDTVMQSGSDPWDDVLQVTHHES